MSVLLWGSAWVGLFVLRHPLTWLWIGLSMAAWPALLALAPIGLTGGQRLETDLIYELAFVGQSLGCLLGMALLGRGGWFLGQRSPAARLVLEFGALSGALLMFTLPGLLPPLLLAGRGELLQPNGLPLRLALCHLHLCALALFLLRLRLSTGLRCAALLAAVWCLPALADPATFAGRFIDSTLAAGAALVSDHESVPLDSIWKEKLAPIIGLVGAALLLRPPSLLHALRHPR